MPRCKAAAISRQPADCLAPRLQLWVSLTEPGTAAPAMIRQDNFSHSQPATTDTNHSSSLVWLIMFAFLVTLSIISNTTHLISCLVRRQFSLPRLLIETFFLLNLLDYALLAVEFSLGEESQYPYSEGSCTAYQALQQASPLLTGCALVLYSRLTLSQHQLYSHRTAVLTSLAVAALLSLLLLPSLIFSEVAVNTSNARYCVIELSGLANMISPDINTKHIVTAVYFLLYKSVLIYWLPLVLTAPDFIRVMQRINFSDDKYLSQSLNLTIVISFFVFNLPLAVLELSRQLCEESECHTWTLQVLASLFRLLSFFFHIFRPLACLILRSDNVETPKISGYQQVQAGGEQPA